MNAPRTVWTVIVFLGIVTIVGLVGLIAILILVVASDRVFDATLLVPVVGITTAALGGMTGLLANTNTSDPAEVADLARVQALADVASLAPSGAHFVSATLEQFDPPTTEPIEGPSGFAPEPSGFGPSFP